MLKHNLGQAFRSFLRNPGFTVAVLLALAVGIGFVTALFSVANGVLLSRLPYREPERLVTIFASFAKDNAERSDASYPDIADWRKQSRSFDDMAAVVIFPSLTLMGNEGSQRIRVSLVSPSYFNLLGVEAAIGRTFLPEEDQKPGGHPVVVLSDGLWQSRFGADPQVIGKPIRLSGQEYTVVGVMPRSFHDLSDEIEAWLPVMMVPATLNPTYLESRTARMMIALARLKPGVSLEQAQTEMDTIGQRLAQEYADTNEGYGVKIYPLSDYVFEFSDIRRSVVMLLLGSAFVLLISCVNVASLFLVRAMNRQREIGLRLAIGADRRHLVSQLLTESLLLSLVGGVLGVLLAFWAVRVLVGLGSIDLPAFVNLGLDGRALGLAVLLSVLTGLIFGMVPAFKSSRVSVSEPLRDARQLGGGNAGIGRGVLIVFEVALAVMLLVAAGLMIRSFWLLHGTSMGFDTERVLTLRVDLPVPKYTDTELRRSFARDLVAEARSLPGVEAAGVWGPGLPGQSDWYLEVTPEDNPAQSPEDAVRVFRHHVSPDALSTLGIPLVKGRYLTPQDTAETPTVAVVSQSMAEALWPGKEPLGKRFLGGPAPPAPVLEVVGVVPDVKHRGRLLDNDIPRDFYIPYFQLPVRDLVLFMRTGSEPASLAAPVRRIVQKLDPDLAVYDISTARDRLDEEEADTRFTAVLMMLYAGVASLLAALGIYSVLAYSVSRRTNEIGIRMALGARRPDVYRTVIGRALFSVLVGVMLGLLGSYALTRILNSLLYGISSNDPVTYALVPLGLVLVALIASWIPARRAMKVEPVTALRYE